MAERRSATDAARTTRPIALPKAPKPMTANQRNKLATQGIVSTLAAKDEKAAVTAALEAVNERLAWDTEFQQSLRQKYGELEALSKPKTPTARAPKPTPIAGPKLGAFNPYGKLDPYQLLEGYGRSQLRAVLTGATPALLREAVGVVQSREPGTKPASQNRKADMIDYIVSHVAGAGY